MNEIISDICNQHFSKQNGFEWYPFKVGWYNEVVDEPFKLSYSADTLCALILSTPKMFNLVFWPWFLKKKIESMESIRDPLDACLKIVVQSAVEALPTECHVIHDFDLMPSRRPKIIMNVAGHVSGASCYYQASDITTEQFRDKRLVGVGIHPVYGGWFAFRAVLIFPNVLEANLPRPIVPRLLNTNDEIINVLEKFNFSWNTGEYRDVVPVAEKYDDRQKQYFHAKPEDRRLLLFNWLKIDASRFTHQ